MADPFESAKRKLIRAKQHIYDFEGCLQSFRDEHPYEIVRQPDVNHPDMIVCKLRLSKPTPDRLELIASDVVNNLRASLDHALYGVAIASGHNITHAQFPFRESADELERAINGKAKYLPNEILTLLRTFKTHSGGNDVLCALNNWCNTDKHSLVSAVETGIVTLHTRAEATGFFRMPQRPTWDRSNHEIELYTTGPHTESLKYNFSFALDVSFDQIELIRGQPAVSVFHAFAAEVESVLMAIEAESRRIGIVK